MTDRFTDWPSTISMIFMYEIKTHRTAASLRSVAEHFLDMARSAKDPDTAKDCEDLASDFAKEAAAEDAKLRARLHQAAG
jgi:hypothetical protein